MALAGQPALRQLLRSLLHPLPAVERLLRRGQSLDDAVAALLAGGQLRSVRAASLDDLVTLACRALCLPDRGRPVLLEMDAIDVLRIDLGDGDLPRRVTPGVVAALLPCTVLYVPAQDAVAQQNRPAADTAAGVLDVYLRLAAQVLGLAMPVATLLIVDKVVAQGAVATLQVLMLGVGLLTVIQYLFLGVQAVLNARRIESIAHGERTSVVHGLLGSRLGPRLATAGWEVVEGCGASVRYRLDGRGQCLADVLYVILLAALMAAFDPLLLAVSCAFVPAYVAVDAWASRRLRRGLRDAGSLRARLTTRYFESTAAAEELHGLRLAGYAHARWQALDADHALMNHGALLARRFNVLGVEFLQRLSLLCIALLGVGAVIRGDLTLGQYIAFNLLSMQFAQPLLRITAFRRAADEQRLRATAAEELAARCMQDPWPAGGSARLEIDDPVALQVRNLVAVKPVAGCLAPGRAVSFCAAGGGWIGIRGRSGCGKTSLLKTVAGLRSAATGQVLIDGVPVERIDRACLARCVRLAPQHPTIFSTTIAENVRLGDPAAAEGWLAAVAQGCGLIELTRPWPEQLDTLVGAAGRSLCGGERQRIAVARAVLGRPKLLLLDEATAALDEEAESVLLGNLRRLLPAAIVVVVAHRPSSLAHCQQIVQLDPAPGGRPGATVGDGEAS